MLEVQTHTVRWNGVQPISLRIIPQRIGVRRRRKNVGTVDRQPIPTPHGTWTMTKAAALKTTRQKTWVEEYADVRALARKAKLPPFMWDTKGACEALFRFAVMVIVEHEENKCVACELSSINDPRCSGMKHTCKTCKSCHGAGQKDGWPCGWCGGAGKQ